MLIERLQGKNIGNWVDKGKALVVIGPRQVGKTTLVRQISQSLGRKTLWLTGDDPQTRAVLDNVSLARMQTIIGQNEVLVVDEAQRFTNAGLMLKLITDHIPNIQLFVTGSSSLDIASQTKENLTGRKIEFHLYPISFAEMCAHHGYLHERSLLEHRLLYGYYPEVVAQEPPQAQKILADLSDGLMYKDLLTLDQIKKPSLLVKLLQALALQLGSEVRYHEAVQTIDVEPVTVERYSDHACNSFFWRTTTQQEVDYVEETNGILYAFEFKWNPNKSGSFPKSFSELYPNSQIAFVDRDNFEQFVNPVGR